jgi:hypothetical protein
MPRSPTGQDRCRSDPPALPVAGWRQPLSRSPTRRRFMAVRCGFGRPGLPMAGWRQPLSRQKFIAAGCRSVPPALSTAEWRQRLSRLTDGRGLATDRRARRLLRPMARSSQPLSRPPARQKFIAVGCRSESPRLPMAEWRELLFRPTDGHGLGPEHRSGRLVCSIARSSGLASPSTICQALSTRLLHGPCDPGSPAAARRLWRHGVPRSHGPSEESVDAESLTFDYCGGRDSGSLLSRRRGPARYCSEGVVVARYCPPGPIAVRTARSDQDRAPAAVGRTSR